MTIYDLIIPVLIMVESGGNFAKVGDGGELGGLQIKPIVLADLKQFHNKDYTREDCFNPVMARKICHEYIRMWYRKTHHGQNPTVNSIPALVRIWNGGPKGAKKPETIPYLLKFRKAYIQFYGEWLEDVTFRGTVPLPGKRNPALGVNRKKALQSGVRRILSRGSGKLPERRENCHV